MKGSSLFGLIIIGMCFMVSTMLLNGVALAEPQGKLVMIKPISIM